MAASSTLDSSSYHHNNNNVGDVSLDYSFTRDSVPSAKSSLGPSSSTQRQATRRNGSTTTNGAAATASSSQQPRQDVWSQILLSVRTARNTATLPIVVLGEPQSGKSTLLRGLAEGCPSGCIEAGATHGGDDDDDDSEGVATPALKEGAAQGVDQRGKRDLGLAYGYCDVPDDEGEDILARLSFYTLSSSDEALLSLLPFALRSSSSSQDPSTAAVASTSSAASSLRKPLPSLPALRDSLFLIVLDWQRPQSFLDELRTWISVIKETIAAAASAGTAGTSNEERSRRATQEAMLDEMKDALEAHIRGYVPPASNAVGAAVGENDAAGGAAAAAADEGAADGAPAPAIVPVSAPLSLGQAGSRGAAGPAMPLDEGVLDENLGVGIVVVLAKSDHVYQLERDRDFKEEQFDYIQQVLRTICLKYGAALFSTAQSRPASFSVLRQYLVHRLLSTSSAPGGGSDADLSIAADGAPAATASSSSRGYPFTHPPSTIERDILLVPSGWDSWGKIVALREGFHPSLTAQGWEFDCRVEERRRSRKLPRTEMGKVEREVRDEEAGEGTGTGAGTSACRLWEDVLGDYRWDRTARGSVSGAPQQAAGSTNSLAAPDAQSFLAQHHATLQKEAAAAAAAGPSSSSTGASDPRAKFARTGSSSSAAAQLAGGRSSIVGPMQSSSLSGPAVERAIGLAQRDDSLSAGGADSLASPPIDGSRPATKRRESREHRSSAIGGSGSRPDSPAIGGVGSTHSSRDSGVTRASSPGGAGASASTKQSEVLQSFFQDLLRGKGGGGGGSAGASPSGGGGAAKSGATRRTERGAGGE